MWHGLTQVLLKMAIRWMANGYSMIQFRPVLNQLNNTCIDDLKWNGVKR